MNSQFRPSGTPTRLTTPRAQGSPSEAMLDMLRKHKQDVHRIANLAAEISVATETGIGIDRMASSSYDQIGGRTSSPRRGIPVVGAYGGAHGGSPYSSGTRSAVAQLHDRKHFNGNSTAPESSSILRSPSRSPSSPQRGTKSAAFAPPSVQTTASNLRRSENGGGSQLTGERKMSPQRAARMYHQSPPQDVPDSSSKKQSPEEKQTRMRYAVNDLFETVQDQRTRAESRGLTLARALYVFLNSFPPYPLIPTSILPSTGTVVLPCSPALLLSCSPALLLSCSPALLLPLIPHSSITTHSRTAALFMVFFNFPIFLLFSILQFSFVAASRHKSSWKSCIDTCERCIDRTRR